MKRLDTILIVYCVIAIASVSAQETTTHSAGFFKMISSDNLEITIIFLFISMAFLSAQELPEISAEVRTSKNSIYALGYGGILTVGYQRLFTERFGNNISAASISLLHEDLRDGFSFPVHFSYYPIGTFHRLFLDFGCWRATCAG